VGSKKNYPTSFRKKEKLFLEYQRVHGPWWAVVTERGSLMKKKGGKFKRAQEQHGRE